MRITAIAIGSRGDIQPIITLSKALKRDGHQVRVVTDANIPQDVDRGGLEVVTTQMNWQALMQSELGREWTWLGTNPVAQTWLSRKLFSQYAPSVMIDTWHACESADLIISSTISDLFAQSVAEKRGVRYISCWVIPSVRATRNGAVLIGAPVPNRNSVINYAFAKLLLEPYASFVLGEATNRFRSEVLGLPPHSVRESVEALHRSPVLYGYSRHVVPHPADWPPNLYTTGYWIPREQEEWLPPGGLLDFLEAGDPPVYIGFGSMTEHDPDDTTRLLLEAVRLSGRRAVLQPGWAEMGQVEMPDEVFRLDYAPFDWLFPRMAAVVHHGGAGTTGAGLRAGVPSVIVPHLSDQSFWGARVHALGAGPRPILRRKLTAPALAEAIRLATSDPDMKRQAEELRVKLRAEDGVAAAVDLINGYAGNEAREEARELVYA